MIGRRLKVSAVSLRSSYEDEPARTPRFGLLLGVQDAFGPVFRVASLLSAESGSESSTSNNASIFSKRLSCVVSDLSTT